VSPESANKKPQPSTPTSTFLVGLQNINNTNKLSRVVFTQINYIYLKYLLWHVFS